MSLSLYLGKATLLSSMSNELHDGQENSLNQQLSLCNYDKCKNHFNEMKGDVGMSLHEKEGNKKNLHQVDNPSLHLCFKKWFALFGIGSERHKIIVCC